LTPSEIVGQVLFLKDHLEAKPTNIVFMGMGEPFDNFENLAKAVGILNSPRGLGIAARRMTVSTAGIIPGIERFGKLGLQINLSVSLHAADEAKRSALMPINRKYPLEKLLSACEDYLKAGGRKITLEYVLLKGVNDTAEDAGRLARVASRLKAKINLIAYSPVAGLPFEVPEESRVEEFKRRLEERGIPVTLRESKGRDIQAACGQLALE
jgi:23S rRNA (adenine2503-C2)-methyltransferase